MISDYALLGDCHTAARVSRTGAVDWWCPARFDAPSVFGALLDPSAGHWTIRPSAPFTARRRYLPGTMVLETEFSTAAGSIRTDALALGAGERGHDMGPDPQVHLDAVARFAKAGYDEIYLHQVGPDQPGFLRFCRQDLLPAVGARH